MDDELSNLSSNELINLLKSYGSVITRNGKIIIAIEGNIGAGKTTLHALLKKKYKSRVCFVDEPTSDWRELKDENGVDMLTLFYSDIKKWAFLFQCMAYVTRARALYKALENEQCDIIIMERSVETDFHAFARKMYDDRFMDLMSWMLYQWWYDFLNIPISGYIYVKTPSSVCDERIKIRGRTGEEDIPIEYLDSLGDYHNEWLAPKSGTKDNVLIIDGRQEFDSQVVLASIDFFLQYLQGKTVDHHQRVTAINNVLTRRIFNRDIAERHNDKTVISIVGSIGAGKTTHLEKLRRYYADDPTVSFVDEPTKSWANLKDDSGRGLIELFYSDIDKWAFVFQIVALISRARALYEALCDDSVRTIIVERSVETDREIFATKMYNDGMINQIEWELYNWWHQFFNLAINGIVHINTPVNICIERTKKRGRDGERNIPEEYMHSLASYHESWLKERNNVMTVDNTQEDLDNSNKDLTQSQIADLEQFISKVRV